jgi:hypothetical protein
MNTRGQKRLFKSKLVFLALVNLAIPLPSANAVGTLIPGTFDCELNLPSQKTDSFLIACADGNTRVYKIKWKSWTMKGALGYGKYAYNDCNPYCAVGHDHFFNVAVSLSKVRYFHQQPYLTYLSWWQTDQSGRRLSGGKSGAWDLYENFIKLGGKI